MTRQTDTTAARAHGASERGTTLAELLVAVALLLSVTGTVTTLLLQMSNVERTVWNRTAMHSGVRGATELLQQEVGQAGLVAIPAAVSLSGAVSPGSQAVTVTSTSGMFVGEQLEVDAGAAHEVVALTAVNTATNQLTATFADSHATGASVQVTGGFASGIVPSTITNGSTGSVLKLYGDINGDGTMVYIEYTCDTVGHKLYRNSMAWNAASKPALSASLVLLNNIVANPNNTSCFTYQIATVNTIAYVTDVAITLTVQTQQKDPVTQQFQTETKTLLNVAPRNVFNIWELASAGAIDRIQPMPPSIVTLLQ